jgi:hypothetical protein
MESILKTWVQQQETTLRKKGLSWLKDKPLKRQAQWMLEAFGATKVPLLFSCRPKVDELSADRCVVKIPLNHWTKNHHGSLYFGALAIGAEAAIGIPCLHEIYTHDYPIRMLFKSFKANFLKRAEGSTWFDTHDVRKIRQLVQDAQNSSERLEAVVFVTAKSEIQGRLEPVAEFELTLSLKGDKKRFTPKRQSKKVSPER